MNLTQLEYFAAAADEGGFSRAAERCGVAQPSLSQQIIKLEDELGVPLFDRLPRKTVLTEAGHRLLSHTTSILASVAEAQRDVRETADIVAGRLRIGAIPTIAPYLLPRVVRRFTRQYPQVELGVEEDVTDRLIERLRSGAVDVVIAAHPIEHEQIHAEPLFDEPLLLVLPADHPLAKRKTIRWDDVADERFMVLQDMHCLGAQVTSLCRRHGIEPDLSLRGAQMTTILEMVTLGVGLSLAPRMTVEADRSRQRVYRRISDAATHRTIVAAWHLLRFRTNAARAFVAQLRRHANRKSMHKS